MWHACVRDARYSANACPLIVQPDGGGVHAVKQAHDRWPRPILSVPAGACLFGFAHGVPRIDVDDKRLAVAQTFGATTLINSADGQAADRVMKLTEGAV